MMSGLGWSDKNCTVILMPFTPLPRGYLSRLDSVRDNYSIGILPYLKTWTMMNTL